MFKNSKEYFSLMRMTKKSLLSDFNDILSKVKNEFPELGEDFEHLYLKRIYGHPLLLRPFLSRIVYELGNKKDWEIHSRIFALIEIINISTYQSNLAFDNKNGIRNEQDKFNQIISSFFSTFIFFDETIKSSYESSKILKIIETTLNSLKEIYYGQFLDLNTLNFNNQSLIESFESFEKVYIARCQNLGSSLIRLCVDICLILNNSRIDEIKEELIEFADIFGLAGQVLNDLGDITSKGRVYSNSKYSDIDNKRLTLPIVYLKRISKIQNFNSEVLIQQTSNSEIIKELAVQVKSYIMPYHMRIENILDKIHAKGFDSSRLRFISKMLINSSFYSIKTKPNNNVTLENKRILV